MKDISAVQFIAEHESDECMTTADAKQRINNCLKALLNEKEHNSTDEVVDGLTYEELAASLLFTEQVLLGVQWHYETEPIDPSQN